MTGGACNAESRICSNGVLSGTYQYTSCVVDCSFNGAVIPHGGNVQAFAAASVPSGSSCASQQRTCNMGTLSGSYVYSSCLVQQPSGGTASCSFNGQTVLHGASVYAYATSSVSMGDSCLNYREARVCNNGSLSGSYDYSLCRVDRTGCGIEPATYQKSFSEAIYHCP